MDWILDNLQLIIVIAGAIAYWINQRAREKAGQEADYDEDGVPEARSPMERSQPPPLQRGAADFDQEERARRIREEIQRKIAERRGQVPPMPKLEPPVPAWEDHRPIFREEPVPPRPEPVSMPAPPPLPSVTVAVDDEAAALDRQRRLAEEFEMLEEQRRAARRVAEDTRWATVTAASGAAARSGASLGGRGIGAELRDPRALRRAIVLREVLSPPVALR